MFGNYRNRSLITNLFGGRLTVFGNYRISTALVVQLLSFVLQALDLDSEVATEATVASRTEVRDSGIC